MGLVNHYYNLRAKAEDPSVESENYFFPGRDVGSLIIVTAIGILKTTDDAEPANRLVEYMLSEEAQRFFGENTFEYPLVGGGLERTKELIDESGLEGS